MKPYSAPYYSQKTVTAEELAGREKQPRCQMPVRPAAERTKDFAPVNLGLSDETAVQEAKRCLECGCHDYAECKLIRYAQQQEIHPERFDGVRNQHEKEQRLEVIERDNGKCILCGLCVRICDEVAKQGILGLVGRGFPTTVKPEFRNPAAVEICRTCKKCALSCPTGALKILPD
jgi:formate dehydrogenase major subunit